MRGEGTVGKGMRLGDCGQRDEARGLWGKGRREGGDCGGKGCGEGTVGTRMRGGG